MIIEGLCLEGWPLNACTSNESQQHASLWQREGLKHGYCSGWRMIGQVQFPSVIEQGKQCISINPCTVLPKRTSHNLKLECCLVSTLRCPLGAKFFGQDCMCMVLNNALLIMHIT